MKTIYTTDYVDGMTCKLKLCSTCKLLHGRKDAYCLLCRQAYMRLRLYGLTREEYKELLDRQNNACAICEETFTAEPRVDHAHSTGRVRGLLCHGCNVGIGLLRDDITRILRAVTYLGAT